MTTAACNFLHFQFAGHRDHDKVPELRESDTNISPNPQPRPISTLPSPLKTVTCVALRSRVSESTPTIPGSSPAGHDAEPVPHSKLDDIVAKPIVHEMYATVQHQSINILKRIHRPGQRERLVTYGKENVQLQEHTEHPLQVDPPSSGVQTGTDTAMRLGGSPYLVPEQSRGLVGLPGQHFLTRKPNIVQHPMHHKLVNLQPRCITLGSLLMASIQHFASVRC